MDFKTYISAIERKLSQMTEIQKTDWIYNQARIVEENQRKDFLDSLSEEEQRDALIHLSLLGGRKI